MSSNRALWGPKVVVICYVWAVVIVGDGSILVIYHTLFMDENVSQSVCVIRDEIPSLRKEQVSAS